ncbi:hypothetical protein V6Z11_D05G082200 [Gossypium hirsutum]
MQLIISRMYLACLSAKLDRGIYCVMFRKERTMTSSKCNELNIKTSGFIC